MKAIFLVVSLSILSMGSAHGQPTAFTSTTATVPPVTGLIQYRDWRECGATRHGRGLMIVGGAAIVLGCAEYFPSKNNPDHSSLALGGILLIGGGLFWGTVGTGLFIGGKIHDNRSGRGFSLTGDNNHLGVAYNF